MARLFASQPSTLQTVTFTSSQTWVAPVGVTNLETVTGKGENGSAYSWSTETLDMMRTAYLGSLGTGDAIVARSTAYNAGVTQANKFSGSTSIRSISYTEYTYACYSDGKTTVSTSSHSVTVKGSAVVSSSTGSGSIAPSNAGSDYVSLDVQVDQGPTYGSDTIGFGNNFNGGSGGSATVETLTDVAVTPGGSYPLTIASGGYITITYYT